MPLGNGPGVRAGFRRNRLGHRSGGDRGVLAAGRRVDAPGCGARGRFHPHEEPVLNSPLARQQPRFANDRRNFDGRYVGSSSGEPLTAPVFRIAVQIEALRLGRRASSPRPSLSRLPSPSCCDVVGLKRRTDRPRTLGVPDREVAARRWLSHSSLASCALVEGRVPIPISHGDFAAVVPHSPAAEPRPARAFVATDLPQVHDFRRSSPADWCSRTGTHILFGIN